MDATAHPGEAFRDWALDPARTNDELCFAELLVEAALHPWEHRHGIPHKWDHERDRVHRAERAGNPAYRPRFTPDLLAPAVEMAPDLADFHNHFGSSERAIRDLSALRFFPALQIVNLHPIETNDLTPLAGLRALKKLTLHEPYSDGGYIVADLAPIAGLPCLEQLTLRLNLPWPDLRAIADLPALRTLAFHGNLLAFRGIGPLPAVETATLGCTFHWKTPVRDFTELPAMPSVRWLKIEAIDSLVGAGRIATVINLDLEGSFRDLAPLAPLHDLTMLRLESDRFRDVAPLAGLPALREVEIVREIPFDISPLSDAPVLREVRIQRCDILRTEVSALNAVLTPWSADFLALEPRPLLPFRFLSYGPFPADKEPDLPSRVDPRDALMAHDPALRAAESRWFHAELQTRLDALLGRGWGLAGEHTSINRYIDYFRLEEIAETLRAFLVTTRFPWQVWLIIVPHGDMSHDLEKIRKLDAGETSEERPWLDDVRESAEDREEWRRERRERFARLQREHRHRTLQELGAPIDPAEFSPPPPEPIFGPPPDEEPKADELPADNDETDEAGGGIAEPPPAPPGTASLGEDLHFQLHIAEGGVVVIHHMRAEAETAFGRPAEAWADQPDPPEQRPRPFR